MKFRVLVTMLEYGVVEVEAENEKSAKKLARDAVNDGKVFWTDSELSDVSIDVDYIIK